MKQLIILTWTLASFNALSQITLEHTYPNSSSLAGGDVNATKQPLMVQLEADGSKYVFIDRAAKTVTFYNLDHTFFKSVSYSATTVLNQYGQPDILYISQHLFDTDDEIEFMYHQHYLNAPVDPFTSVTEIVDEDGTILFSESGSPAIKTNYHQQQYPIYNTSAGTKLMLSMNNEDVNIYSIQGELSPVTVPSIDESVSALAYPNPTSTEIVIPIGKSYSPGESYVEIYDINGNLVREVRIGSSVVEVKLNIENLASGTYFYVISDGDIASEGKKFVKN